MKAEFNGNNNIVKLCMMGMIERDHGKSEEASNLFLKAWHEATDDFERFIAAYFVAHNQKDELEKLKWLELSLQFALKQNDDNVKSAYANPITKRT